MLRREAQGKGYGSEAVRLTLLRAKAEAGWGTIHAFPGVTNGASNAICRKLGFEQLEECEGIWDDHLIRSNHWRLDFKIWNPD